LVFVASAVVAGVAVQPRTAKALYALNTAMGCVPELTNKVTYFGGNACSTGTASSVISCPYDDDEDMHQGLVTSVTVTGVDNSGSGVVSVQACAAPQLWFGLFGHCGGSVSNAPASNIGAFALSPPLSGQWGAGFGLQAAFVTVVLPSGGSNCVQSVSVNN